MSGSTTPLRLTAPDPRSRWRAYSESLRRRWRVFGGIPSSVGSTVGCIGRLVSMGGRVLGDMAEAVEGLRLGVDALDDTADNPGSAGVEGGGWGPGGLSESTEGAADSEPNGTRVPASDSRRSGVGPPCEETSLPVGSPLGCCSPWSRIGGSLGRPSGRGGKPAPFS